MRLPDLDARLSAIFVARQDVQLMPVDRDISGGDSAGWGKGCDGPAWIAHLGALSFTDAGHHRRLIWTPGKEPQLLQEHSGGALGSALDREGRLVSAEWAGRRISRIEADGTTTCIADSFAGRPFHRPDDVTVGPDGTIYFTDQFEAFPSAEPDRVQKSGVYRVPADLSAVERLAVDDIVPAGLHLTLDGKVLLVSDMRARRIVRVPLDGGAVSDFFVFPGGKYDSTAHGLCIDAEGRVYAGGPGGLWVFEADGSPLGTLLLPPSRINNVAFGGEDGSTLFVVSFGGIAAIATRTHAPRPIGAPALLRERPRPIPFAQYVERLDPALDAIIPPDAVIRNYGTAGFIEDLGGGAHYLFSQSLEGLFWSTADDCLYFSDIGNDRRMRLDRQGRISEAHRPTGFTNGATLDRDGVIVQCEQGFTRRVARRHADGTRTVVADRWDDKRLNHPNDCIVRSDGTIFFTDPWWDFGDGDTREIPHAGVYQVSPDLKTVTLIGHDYVVPNGLALSPDERTLYVNDSYGLPQYGMHIRAYDIRADGSVDSASARVAASLHGPGEGKPDGMKIDRHGNIFCGGPGGLWVMDRQGKHLGTIVHGATQTNNLAFGGDDWRTLYFCSWNSMHSIDVSVEGMPVPAASPQ